MPENNLKKAYDIATECLRKCYDKHGIFAGRKHFTDYWARDSFYASLGSLVLDDIDIVRKNLEMFLKHQKENGQIPLRIGETSEIKLVLKMFGFKFRNKLKAKYIEDKKTSVPTDQNSLLLITAKEYVANTKDVFFLKKYYTQFSRAFEWNLSRDEDNDLLIEEGHYATWADAIKKSGKVLYTNVLNYEAANCMAGFAKRLNKKADERYFGFISKKIKEEINTLFWNGSYYVDWVDKTPFNYFSTDGNMFAILFGIADKAKAKKISRSAENYKIHRPVPSKTNCPSYPIRYVSPVLRLAGIGDYHNNSVAWLWIGCISAAAYQKAGLKKQANKVMESMADKINEYGTVYEVYEKNGKPLNRLIYKSEVPFAWSSGLFIWATSRIFKNFK